MSRSFATKLALALAVFAGVMSARVDARPHATPTPSPTPVPGPEDPAVTAIARHEFVSWQLGTIDKSRYTPAMQEKMTDDAVADTAKKLGSVGPMQKMEFAGLYAAAPDTPGGRAYVYHVICTYQNVFEVLTLGPDGKIAGINFEAKLESGS